MKVETEKIVNILTNDYNIPQKDINVKEATEVSEPDFITIRDTSYHIYGGMTPNEIEDMASYIHNEQENDTKKVKEELEQPDDTENIVDTQQQVAENLQGIKVGNIYKYHPSFLDVEGHRNESKLAQLATYDLACRVKDILITSKEEDEGFIKVTFDIAENEEKEKDLPDFYKEDFIVFESDLSPYDGPVVSDEQAEEPDEKIEERVHVVEGNYPAEYKNMYNLASSVSESDIVVPNNDEFSVATDYHFDENGDIELVMRDGAEEWYKYIGKPHDWSALKNLYLTTKDSTIDVPLELYYEILNEYFKPEEKVKEDLENTTQDTTNTSTALLTALNSEKEAVMTYEMLIKMSTDNEEIELLRKILEDEKEHVSLLSALQSKKTADSVAEDNKEQLDGYAEDVIQTPAAE